MIIEKSIGMIYPRVCPVCGEIITENKQRSLANAGADPYICPECLKLLDFLEGRRCLRCSRQLESDDSGLCSDCRRKNRNFDSGFALIRHNDEARKIIYDMKYEGLKQNADFAAWEMARHAGPALDMWKPEVFIPVPLHKTRLKERGYNQAETLARGLSYELKETGHISIPVDAGYTIRSRKTSPQKGLDPAARSENIRGAFEVAANEPPGKYRSAVIVDDIFTTGSTINEIAGLLRKNGMERIYFVTCSIVG